MAKIIGNTTATPNPQANWTQTDETKADYIKNKPFGETYGDTATYNGELTEPNVIVEQADGTTACFVKVSDAVPTVADMEGKEITYIASYLGGDYAFTEVFPGDTDTISDDGLIVLNDDFALIIPYDNYDVDGIVFPSKGVYMLRIEYDTGEVLYAKNLTIPSYAGFPVLKKIDSQYLPEYLDFGEKESDTLFWDGNTEGRESFGVFYYISNALPTLDDFSHGCEITARSGEDVVTFTDVQVATEDSYFVLVVNDAIVAFIGAIGLSSGTFFASTNNYYVESLTINGYKGFTKTGTIEDKYLPDTIQRVGDDLIINSSTEGSTKKFKITVDDSGTITATEVT